jgi:hypothetical protein
MNHFLLENLLFLVLATSFFVVTGWAWRHLKPYELPQPLPGWFTIWFLTVQIVGGLLPLVAMLLWGVWWSDASVLLVFVPYFVLLELQILSESLSLRQFRSVVFVMIPYLYLPFRIWQLYRGLSLLNPAAELIWVRNLLLVEIVLWAATYVLDLTQLPRLLRWEARETPSKN